MKLRDLIFIAAAGIAVQSCDKIPFLGGTSEEAEEQSAEAEEQSEEPTAESSEEATPAQPAGAGEEQQPAQRPSQRPAAGEQQRISRTTAAAPLAEEPWTPAQTGTVNPGMTADNIIAVWGEPAHQITANNRSYLYYRNGCEISCGTFDVVLLEGNQVVDAIVRGAGHVYSGVSSSPPERIAEFTPPDLMEVVPGVDSAAAFAQ